MPVEIELAPEEDGEPLSLGLDLLTSPGGQAVEGLDLDAQAAAASRISPHACHPAVQQQHRRDPALWPEDPFPIARLQRGGLGARRARDPGVERRQ